MRHVLLLLLAPLGTADDLDAGWVAKDVEVARRVAAALASGETRLDELLKKLGAASTEEGREIGFGARRLRLALYGGYTTTWVTIVAWNGRVGPVEAFCHEGDDDTWAAIKDQVAAEYKGRAC